jgi:hypothetical protein
LTPPPQESSPSPCGSLDDVEISGNGWTTRRRVCDSGKLITEPVAAAVDQVITVDVKEIPIAPWRRGLIFSHAHLGQGCQMVYLHTKIPNFGKFRKAWK